VPAPAVIPAQVAYVKIVAVKELVVGDERRFLGKQRRFSLLKIPFVLSTLFYYFTSCTQFLDWQSYSVGISLLKLLEISYCDEIRVLQAS